MFISRRQLLIFTALGAAAGIAYAYSQRNSKVDEVASEVFDNDLNFNYKEYTQRNVRAISTKKEDLSTSSEDNHSPVNEVKDLEDITDEDVLDKNLLESTRWIDSLIRALDYENTNEMKITTLVKRAKSVALNPASHPPFVQQAVFSAIDRVGNPANFHSYFSFLSSDGISYPCALTPQMRRVYHNLNNNKGLQKWIKAAEKGKELKAALLIHCCEFSADPVLVNKAKKLAKDIACRF